MKQNTWQDGGSVRRAQMVWLQRPVSCLKHGSYARSHGSSLRPWPRIQGTRHRLGISSRTSWSVTPSLTVARPIYLEHEIKTMSGEESRLTKLPSKENDQMTRKGFCLPKPIDDAKTGLTGSWVCTKYRTRADMPPAAKDFWLPLFIYPITPPATEIKGRTISNSPFFALSQEQSA